MASVTKSVRLPEEMVQEIERHQPGNFNKVVKQLLSKWLKARKRAQEDALIGQALAGRSKEQIAEEQKIVKQSSDSARRVLKESRL